MKIICLTHRKHIDGNIKLYLLIEQSVAKLKHWSLGIEELHQNIVLLVDQLALKARFTRPQSPSDLVASRPCAKHRLYQNWEKVMQFFYTAFVNQTSQIVAPLGHRVIKAFGKKQLWKKKIHSEHLLVEITNNLLTWILVDE